MFRKTVILLSAVLAVGALVTVPPRSAEAVGGSGYCPSTNPATNGYCYSTATERFQYPGSLKFKMDASVHRPSGIDYTDAIANAISMWNAAPTPVGLQSATPLDNHVDITIIAVNHTGSAAASELCPGIAGTYNWSSILGLTCPHSAYMTASGYKDHTFLALNEATIGSDMGQAANTAAHEIGHALGLNHITLAPALTVGYVNVCNYKALMSDGADYQCATAAGYAGSCSASSSPLHGQLGPGADEFAALNALYGTTDSYAKPVCRPSLTGKLIDYDYVRLRSEPSTAGGEATVKQTLRVGATFEVISVVPDKGGSTGRTWARVRLSTNNSRDDGYIASSYAAYSGSVYVTSGTNVYRDPATTSPVIGSFRVNARFTITGPCNPNAIPAPNTPCATDPIYKAFTWSDSSARTYFKTGLGSGVYGWVPARYTAGWSV